MKETILGIDHFEAWMVLGILVFFSFLETLGGWLHSSKRSRDDWMLEFVSFVVLGALLKPLIIGFVLLIANQLFPSYALILSGASFFPMLLLFLLVDDFLQYWYHRSAHEYEWLWKLHRPHHLAEEMGFMVSYRNSFLYYVMIPNLWWAGIFLFMGSVYPFIIGVILKQLVIIGSHSPTKWDQFLYRYKILRPLAWVLERILITPSVHFAHHGKSKKDGISDPNGNFGNMFFIWDQLFGTALITRQYPNEFGMLHHPQDSWAAHYFYPIIKSKDSSSEISRGFEKKNTTSLEPEELTLNAGIYLWCVCGKSKNQPFCDGTHHGSKFKPLVFELKKDKKVRLCNCKLSNKAPFCDNSHLQAQASTDLKAI